MADKSFIGKGKLHLKVKGAADGLRPIGNVSVFQFTANEEKKELQDFQSAGGGVANTLRRITGVEGSITLHDYSVENLALALFGSTSQVTAEAVSDEALTAYDDKLSRTEFVIDTDQTVTVTGTGGTPTYVEGTDYTVSPAGITQISGGSIGDGTAIEVSYTKKAVDVLQALTDSGQEYQVVLDGLNEAQSGKAVVIDVHRMKFSPGQNLDVIGDDFGGIELTADVLKDESIVGAGLSQYLKWSQVA